MNKTQIKAMLASYLRSVLGAAVALYLAGVTDPTKLLLALVAAVLPVAIRAINPNDPAFGRLPDTASVDAALSKAKAADAQALLDGIQELEKLFAEKKKTAAKPAPKKPTK